MVKRIAVIGTGYVGLVTGACFAALGHRVTGLDKDTRKIEVLRNGGVPIYEPGLEPLLRADREAGLLDFTTSAAEAVHDADFVFMCVGTPATEDGRVDLSYLLHAHIEVAAALNGKRPVIVTKSSVPPGATEMMQALSRDSTALQMAANPEFLREGHAVKDFMEPTRIVVGAESREVALQVAELYKPIDAPVVITDTRTAEMIKFASNAFLATKVSFINEIASICEHVGVDIDDVARGIGLDPRIGMDYLAAGIGYGGSCLPKDIAILMRVSAARGVAPVLLHAVAEVNAEQPKRLVARLSEALRGLEGARVAVFGYAFKADTDDTRSSPARDLIRALHAAGAEVRCHDPVIAQPQQPFEKPTPFLSDPYEAARGCDAVAIATDWPAFRKLDLARLRAVMNGGLLADGRNIIDPAAARAAGFTYLGVGRGRSSTLPAGGAESADGRNGAAVETDGWAQVAAH